MYVPGEKKSIVCPVRSHSSTTPKSAIALLPPVWQMGPNMASRRGFSTLMTRSTGKTFGGADGTRTRSTNAIADTGKQDGSSLPAPEALRETPRVSPAPEVAPKDPAPREAEDALVRCIERVTKALATASDDDVIELILERKALRAELAGLREAGASNILRPRFGAG